MPYPSSSLFSVDITFDILSVAMYCVDFNSHNCIGKTTLNTKRVFTYITGVYVCYKLL